MGVLLRRMRRSMEERKSRVERSLGSRNLDDGGSVR